MRPTRRCVPIGLSACVSASLLACAPEGGESGAGESSDSGSADFPIHGDRHAATEELRQLADDHDVEALEEPPAVRDELFALGQALAFDKILSGNKNLSCMTCHHPALDTNDKRALPRGEGGEGLGQGREGGPLIPRNSPHLFNLHGHDTQFWDSRVQEDDQGGLITPAGSEITPEMVDTFEFGVVSAQAMFPVTSRIEMRGMPGDNEIADADDLTEVWARLMERLGEVPEYVEMFEAAYPGERFEDMTFAHAANAMAGFELRAFEATSSPWQWFLRGHDFMLTNAEVRGALEFFESGCADCHSGPMLSDGEHHTIGLAQFGPGKGDGPDGRDDFGREQVTGDEDDRYAFRTPTLHNIALTEPYGHAGQFADLESFVEHYDDPVESLLSYDIAEHVEDEEIWDMQTDNTHEVIARIDSSAEVEVENQEDLIAFLHALTDPTTLNLYRFIPSDVPSGLPVSD